MSFRNPFITDFIYQASDETRDANEGLRTAFKKYARHIAHEVDERGYGYFAGTLSSLDGSISDTGIEELARELEKATKVPFRLTVLFESGPAITYEISPRDKLPTPHTEEKEV